MTLAAEYPNAALTEAIIGAAYQVHRRLGSGFLEKVYENALAVELRRLGLGVGQQVPISVIYEGVSVGEYFADLIVDGQVIVEIKVVNELSVIHHIQLVNYLKATGIEVGLLINFGQSVQVVRKVSSRTIRVNQQ